MRRLAIAIAATSAVLAACATSYQPTGFTGGFNETFLAPDVVRVQFEGNGFTSGTRAQDFAMLRAAELMLEGGYPFFVVVGESNDTQMSTYTTPGRATTTGSAYTSGDYTSYSGSTTYNPGQTMVFYKPSSGLLVKGFADKPENLAVFDARFVVNSIKTKYELD